MKVRVNSIDRIPADKLATVFGVLYKYLDEMGGGKISIQGMNTYITLKDEDGDTVSLEEDGSEVWWEVRSQERKKPGSERDLVYGETGLYIYRHVGGQ